MPFYGSKGEKKNKNIKIDNTGFDREMEKSKKLARANWKGSGDKSLEEKWFKVSLVICTTLPGCA